MQKTIRIGIDIGSTTAKMVAIGSDGHLLFSKYVRHHAQVQAVTCAMLQETLDELGNAPAQVHVTGLVGLGLAERLGLPFVQEVVAATKAVQARYPQTASMIDIGGEDAKVVFFEGGSARDLRMNGNCAGGTGAFIDQMAVILGTDVQELDRLAQTATRIYPIASRCGVFCKTDIQNLIAKNVSRPDIAASIFHAVAVQTVVTLAHGGDIAAPVLFCGGPLTFLPALRRAFADYLHLKADDFVTPPDGMLMPAFGAALSGEATADVRPLADLVRQVRAEASARRSRSDTPVGLPPIFESDAAYAAWRQRMSGKQMPQAELRAGLQEAYIGIDSGSTTTKIVATDARGQLLFSHYCANGGNPIGAVAQGLEQLRVACDNCGATLEIKGACSTGYGEDLIKAAFQLDNGMVETMAHYMAAAHIDPAVSFILDIGGQDMKAMFVSNGVVNRIEINEACSSGCGSFIETFARTLGYTALDFAQAACWAEHPCDLGTRCTVFMNSKVKQVLREGATVSDIAAGLAYSVVKNCLYKVLKLKDASALGQHIVVQGGTMRNDAVVRALERLTGAEVSRCDVPELMGAYGCALYARQHAHGSTRLADMLAQTHYTTTQLHCKGCENRCLVTRYRFASGQNYYSGNRCERVFVNGGQPSRRGANLFEEKRRLLFGRAKRADGHLHSSAETPSSSAGTPRLRIGIPRCLNQYENFPFWHALFEASGMEVVLSDVSDFGCYERSARLVMADNICFPAKLVHSHVENLIEKGVDRIFLPFVIFERPSKGEQNSYNCPIVTAYVEVIKSVQGGRVPIEAPAISFRRRTLLCRQCIKYLASLGVDKDTAAAAFDRAEKAQQAYACELARLNREVCERAGANRFVVLLAGRPYHADALIQHQMAEMIAGMGIDVITEDVVRGGEEAMPDVHFLAQWAYPDRILKAAAWCAAQADNVQLIQLTSFGCGPDAFLTDSVRELLLRHGKTHTLLKLDDINNAGSMKLRVRSLVESLKLKQSRTQNLSARTDGAAADQAPTSSPQAPTLSGRTPMSVGELRKKKILTPFFTPFISPLIPALLQVAGYDADTLPMSDETSGERGLKYANNEVCYPATLIVGDIIKALRSGRYDPRQTVVAMTQTGGQCRASNYVPLIRKALADAGFAHTPVVPLTFGGRLEADWSGLRMNWAKMLPVALRAILYSDCMAKFYYATAPREVEHGRAKKLLERYLTEADGLIRQGKSILLMSLLEQAACDFDKACRPTDCPRVGVVGEIFLKFNPYAHRHLTDWLTDRGIEVVPSALTDFFLQSFVNGKVRRDTDIERRFWPEALGRWGYALVWRQIERANRAASGFRHFVPFRNIFDEAAEARRVISLNAQFGEGWLLPAEVMGYARQGVHHVVSLQPFGCIANHIVSKGIEKRIKTLLPEMNLLSLDFDGGVSDVNVTNRLLLFVDSLKTHDAAGVGHLRHATSEMNPKTK